MSQAVLSGVGTLLGSTWSLGASVSEAESEGVVRRHTRGTVWFRHPLLAEVLYDETPADLARELHAAYAQVISSLDGASRTRYAGDLAAHYERAGNADEAFVWSLRAADSAAGLHASAEAAIHLARACQLAQRLSPDVRPSDADLVALLLRASRAVEFVGDQAQAMRFIERAVMLVDRERQPLLMSTLLVSWSRLQWQRDAPTRSVQPESLEALRLTDPYPDSAERAAALSELASLESWDGHREKAALLAEEAVAVARRAGSPVALADALSTRAMVDLSLSTAWEDAGEAYQLARATRSADVMVGAAIWQVNYLQAKEKVAEAAELAREAFEEGLRLGALHWCYFLAGMAAADLIGLGRWDEARALLREALAARCAGIPGALVRFVSAQLATRTGDLHQARQHLERAFELVSPGFPGLSYSAYLAESEVLLAEGNARAAVTLTTTAVLKESERDGAVAADDLLWPVGSLAAVAQQARDAGDVACLDRVQDELAAFLSEVRCPELAVDPVRDPALAASRALLGAELARCRARADEAAVWEQAVAANDAIGARWRQVYGMWRWAQALLRAGAPRKQVAAVLRPAHLMAAGMGATVLADELAFLARGVRVTLDAPEPAVRDPAARNAVVLDGHPADGAAPHADENGALPGLLSRLTEREREVLGHLIAGRSNSEIARTLVISAKTVSVHVSNILAKTGTTSRTDAAALARRLGCPAP
jgi:DNA-binding CsgD family transcriptional regulator/tetratricopeptide (TPR) repeat protein